MSKELKEWTMVDVTLEQFNAFIDTIKDEPGYYTGQDVGRTHGMGSHYAYKLVEGYKPSSAAIAEWSWYMDNVDGQFGTAKRVWTWRIAEPFVPSQRPVTLPMIEERYIVVKLKHLTEAQEARVRNVLANIDIGTVECMVVEKGWPMYNETVTSVLTWAALDTKKGEADGNV